VTMQSFVALWPALALPHRKDLKLDEAGSFPRALTQRQNPTGGREASVIHCTCLGLCPSHVALYQADNTTSEASYKPIGLSIYHYSRGRHQPKYHHGLDDHVFATAFPS
jgi:hypothetical protein